MLVFASAGNTALRHWSGVFQPNANGFHQWVSGRIANSVSPWGTDPVSVELYGPSCTQFQVQVVNANTGKSVEQKDLAPPLKQGFNVVRFEPHEELTYQVQVHSDQKNPAAFHLVVLGGGLTYATNPGSISFPADGPQVVAVGAASWDGLRLSYSSCGPNSPVPKPDLVAPVPFPSLVRSWPFSGTSAAAPQAAALAALWWTRFPDWNPNQVRQALQNSALDLGPPGHDWETGYGRIRLPNAVPFFVNRLLPFFRVP
jgi:subtilisin family serine protease